jgi:broad specificity phosphatase PhoE
MRTRLIFVRHAEAEGNAFRRFHGWTDSPITEKGHAQAKNVAERLKDVPIDVIYSSSMRRTIQTCEYIAKVKNLPIIRTDKLKEINGGDWEDKRWDELAEIWPQENETWENQPHAHKMPNGESMVEFLERLLGEVHKIIDDNKGKNVCIVTHGTAIRAMMCTFQSCDLVQMINIPWYDNTSVTIIDHEDGKFDVIVEGDASHLDKELSTLQNQAWWSEHIENIKSRENNLG